jgi:oxidoreductase
VRTVVVGLGWVAREVWLPRLLKHPGFELVGVVEPRPEAVARAAAAFGQVPVYRKATEVPLDHADLVFILTPNHTHEQVADWFLRHGLTVFLEKPAGVSQRELDLLEAAASEGGGTLVLSAAARYRSDVTALHRLVADGTLGTPRIAELSWVRARGIPSSGWFTDRGMAGGGALIDLGWHVIDVAHYLWGISAPQTASAFASADFLCQEDWAAAWRGPQAADPGGASHRDVEDQLTAMVITAAYAMTLRFAWASHEQSDVTTIVLHGTSASAALRTTFGLSPQRVSSPSLLLKRGGTVQEIQLRDDRPGTEYGRQLDALAGLVTEPEATARALADARGVLAVVEACYHAAGTIGGMAWGRPG